MLFKPWSARLCLIGPLLLTACGTGRSDPAPVVSPVVNPCDPIIVREYLPAQQELVAREMEAASETAEWPGMIADYGRMRDAVRACKGRGS